MSEMLRKKQQRLAGGPGLAVVAIAAFFLFFSPIHAAASQIHFDIDTITTGTISWAGGDAPLVGANIEVDQVMGLGTPSHAGVGHDLTKGLLNFTTGPMVNTSSSGNIYTWSFGQGGSLTLTGGVPVITTTDKDTELIYNGEFIFDTVTCVAFSPYLDKWCVTMASFTDKKNDALLNYYGMPIVPYTGQFNISFEVAAGTKPLDGFKSSEVLSGDISNYPQIPIPGAVWLLGSGLIGLVVVRRRFVKS